MFQYPFHSRSKNPMAPGLRLRPGGAHAPGGLGAGERAATAAHHRRDAAWWNESLEKYGGGWWFGTWLLFSNHHGNFPTNIPNHFIFYFIFSHSVGNVIIPIDELIFFGLKPPTSGGFKGDLMFTSWGFSGLEWDFSSWDFFSMRLSDVFEWAFLNGIY